MRDVELYQQLLDSWQFKTYLYAKDKRVPARLGVHEKTISKWARYITPVCDLDAFTVEYVAEARRLESLDGDFLSFCAAQLESIRAVAMDWWPPGNSGDAKMEPSFRLKSCVLTMLTTDATCLPGELSPPAQLGLRGVLG